VIEQARIEGVPLSDAERHTLSWSEVDPEFTPDFTLAGDAELNDEEFGAKVAGLIKRALKRESQLDPSARQRYRAAQAKLNEGDHYIAIMVATALD
jgi:hypothetical protein